MKRSTHILIAGVLFTISGFAYLIFELSAPYCAKHVCGCTSGGHWALVPVVCVLLVLLGVLDLVTGVIINY